MERIQSGYRKVIYNANAIIRESIDCSCQEINRMFVIAYEDGANRVTVGSHRRYFLPRVEIKDYNMEILLFSKKITD